MVGENSRICTRGYMISSVIMSYYPYVLLGKDGLLGEAYNYQIPRNYL
jgi:hypothetical protein